ncbi:hypothetical protein L7F22_014884 [Adiantum nelumboides]|nr:hypothetical protein [Adiantum nelumboides]
MAVPTTSLHGRDSDDVTRRGSSCEEKEEEELMQQVSCTPASCETNAPRRQQRGSSSNSDIAGCYLQLHKRISQTTYPHQLSPEALLLLGELAGNMILPPSSIDPDIAPLYRELHALREIIPPQPTKVAASEVDKSSPSACLITHALDYLDHMNREMKSLQRAILQETTCTSNASAMLMNANKWAVKVEHVKDSKLRIHVQCKQRRGLLSNLLFATENLGLVIEQMDVSSNKLIKLDMIASKVHQKRLDLKLIEQALHDTIFPALYIGVTRLLMISLLCKLRKL